MVFEFATKVGIPEEKWGDFGAIVDPDGARPWTVLLDPEGNEFCIQ